MNHFAMAIERRNDAANLAEAPRIAWVNDVPIYEPTIQAEQWFRDYAQKWYRGKSLTIALAWACANAIETCFFDAFRVEKAALKAIVAWYRGLACTEAQLSAALDYALNGERVNEDYEGAPHTQPRAFTGCAITESINQAVACGLGVSVAELRTMPHTRLLDILRRWTRNEVAMNGGNVDKLSDEVKESALNKYWYYLDSIKARIAANG